MPTQPLTPTSAILLIHCPDAKGLVAEVSSFITRFGGNILHADQHQDNERGLFFMRVEWSLEGFGLEEPAFRQLFTPIANRYAMLWRLEYQKRQQRVAILVSRYQHCLADLLLRHRMGELACEIPVVISNHEDARELAAFYGIPFQHVPALGPDKQAWEQRQLELLHIYQADVVVLARYMQILSPDFVAQFPNQIINVHHSFLPAFVGSRPYHAAFERGVKLIGSTSHYVTEVLDDGPIIEQDVVRVSHRDLVSDLIAKGRDLERIVLSRAVRWHLQHRILSYGNKTVVFD